MIDLTLDPVFGSYALVALMAIGFAFLLFALRDASPLAKWQIASLWGLRLALCLLLILALLRPGLTFTRKQEPRGSVAVMLDASASMQLASGEAKQTRWQISMAIWDSLWKARSQLGKQTVLIPFLYDSKTQRLGEFNSDPGASPPTFPLRPEGNTTDIGGTLNQVASESFDSPLTAVIWLGDGTQTQTPASIDPQQVARQFGRMDIPMYLIGIGPRGDSENARDVSVEGVPEQLDVYTKNQIYVRGMVKCRGVANRDIPLILWMVDRDGVARIAERTTVRPNKPEQSLPFQIPLVAPDAGSYELVVRAEPIEGEVVQENNEAVAYLNVRGGGARVLYIEGEPRTEAKFIANALMESQDLQVDRLWIAKEPIQKWPIDLSRRLSKGVYDCFILGDLDSDAIGTAGAKLIADQVVEGSGLITLGGYHAYNAGGWDRSPLADILPVQMIAGPRQSNNDTIELRNHHPGPIRIVPRAADKLLQIGEPGADLTKIWGEMKPLLGANRWEGVKNMPGVKILAQGEAGQPLIVSGATQKGRVISLAFDSTYQWMRQGKANEFKQFWRQLVLWCLRREAIEEGMQLSMSQRRLFLQQSAEVQMNWNPGTDDAPMPQNVNLKLWRLGLPNEGQVQEQEIGAFDLKKRDAMSMKLRWDGRKEAGRYEWRATANGSKGQPIEARLPFIVMDQSVENMQPLPDWQLISQLAKLNATAGGKMVLPEQTDEMIRWIAERRRQATETQVENFRLGDTAIDSWLLFLVVAGILILQWVLRKRWGLP
jgi:uncharacterized membrane protein